MTFQHMSGVVVFRNISETYGVSLTVRGPGLVLRDDSQPLIVTCCFMMSVGPILGGKMQQRRKSCIDILGLSSGDGNITIPKNHNIRCAEQLQLFRYDLVLSMTYLCHKEKSFCVAQLSDTALLV